MNELDRELAGRLGALRERNLFRELRRVDSPQGTRIEIGEKSLLNFSSNDYLGLANHPALKQAAVRAVRDFGAGSGAARLVCGSLAPHHELEEALAEFKGAEAALTFSSGYATALGTVGALVGKGDVVILDRLAHACLVDAARLSGAKLRVFAHNDLNDLEDILKWAAARSGAPRHSRTLIITESVFSMDGDRAPLRELVELKDRFGAWLMLDEAHATGLFGDQRRGLAEALGVRQQVEVQMGTLGKALGASGGYICGLRALVDLLVNRARSFMFSTAPVPAASAAATAAVRLVRSAEGASRCARVWQRVSDCATALESCSSPKSLQHADAESDNPRGEAKAVRFQSPILPLIVGNESAALALAATLHSRGIFVPAIRYPTVARGAARLRITVTAAHAPSDIATLADALRSALDVSRSP